MGNRTHVTNDNCSKYSLSIPNKSIPPPSHENELRLDLTRLHFGHVAMETESNHLSNSHTWSRLEPRWEKTDQCPAVPLISLMSTQPERHFLLIFTKVLFICFVFFSSPADWIGSPRVYKDPTVLWWVFILFPLVSN